MISESHTRYGSGDTPGGARHGNVRRWRSYQASKAAACGNEAAAPAVARCCLAAFAATVMVVPSSRGMTERFAVNKPSRSFAKPLRELLGKVVGETFNRQGFASAELVTRWIEIVGTEIAAHTEPVKIQWPRPAEDSVRPPGILILRVEGPAAIEIQHLAEVICDRINRFLGWRAIERIALRQAPLRRAAPKTMPADDPAVAAKIAAGLPEIADEDLRQALARLKAAVRRG